MRWCCVAGLLAGLLAAGCGSGGVSMDAATLHVGNGAEVQDLDPHLVSGVTEHRVLSALFEGLADVDPATLEPVPGAASSWEVSPDGLTYTFRLRGDSKWSNGDPVTAYDFAYSWRRMLSPALGAEYAYMLHCLKNAQAYNMGELDDFTRVGVRVVDDLSTGRAENLSAVRGQLEFMEGDLCEPEVCAAAVRDMDYVLHQAALPSVPRSVAQPEASHHANATATLNLLSAARDAAVRRFVFASSSSVYGDQPGECKHEGMPLDPQSPYAAAKAACEHYLRAFHVCYGMETVGLRYFNVFGPRQRPDSAYAAVVPKFIRAVLAGERPVVYGDGMQARDFTPVENNVWANWLAATGAYPACGQMYNIACGESWRLLDLLGAINAYAGTRLEPEFAAPRAGDIRLSRADISRARAELGYAVRVGFREGLEQTIGWFREIAQTA